MKRGTLICFSGIDGAGKTTLARHLVQTLNISGLKYRYVYARFLPFLVRPFWFLGKKIIIRSKSGGKDYKEYCSEKQTVMRNLTLSRIHEGLLLIDYALQILVKVHIPLLFGRNLICDRYVYDTVVSDLATDLSYPRNRVIEMINFCLRFVPKPNLIFLIDVDEHITLERKTDVPDILYLQERRSIYQQLKSQKEIIVVDGSETLAQNKAFVLSKARSFLQVLQ